MPEPTKSKNLVGDVNGVTANQEIFGWALDLNQPEHSIQVDIFVDGQKYTVTSDVPRPDIKSKIISHINHGFKFALPDQSAATCSIEVKYADTGVTLPRGKIEHTRAPAPSQEPTTILSDVNSLGKDGDVFGWVFDKTRPSAAQEIQIEIGPSTWNVIANQLREDVGARHENAANCGFKWPVPKDIPPGEYPIKATHARTKKLLGRGSGMLMIPLQPENATQDIDTLSWPVWKNDTAFVEVEVDCECFYDISLVVPKNVVDGLEIRVNVARNTDEYIVIDTRRANRTGRSIAFEQKELSDDIVLISVRCCVRRPDSFESARFLEKKWPATLSLILTGKPPVDPALLSTYMRAVRLTPPMLSFDVSQFSNTPAQSGAIVSLPRDETGMRSLSDQSVFQVVSLFMPTPVPDLVSIFDNVLGRDDIEVISKLVSIVAGCQIFKRNPKRNTTDFGDIIGFDGWYDLSNDDVTGKIEELQNYASIVVCETQYEVSKMRAISDSNWGLHFVGGIATGPDFHAFASECMAIVVNFNDPAGGDTSALLKFMNICLNSGSPIIVPPADISKSRLVRLLNWVFDTGESAHFVQHLSDPSPRSAFFRSYIAHRVRCKMAPLITAVAKQTSSELIATAEDKPSYRSAPDLSVSVISVSKRPWMIQNIMANFDRQAYPHKDHIIVLHGDFDEQERERVAAAVRAHPDTRIIYKKKWLTLGSCINAAVALSDADYVAKFDDDDYYGENFLTDAVRQIWMTGAEIYTQPLNLIYLEHQKTLVYLPDAIKKGMRFVDPDSYTGFFGSGGTLILNRHVADKVKFSDDRRGGLDSDWFFRAVSAGHRAYIGAGFNYTFVRRPDKGSHTWAIEDDHFLNAGVVLCKGDDLETAVHSIDT